MLREPVTSIRFGRLLLTGAAGGLGGVLRERLARYCDVLRLSDVAPLGEAAAGEEIRPAALQDLAAVHRLFEGVDAVIHLGGVSTEQPWEPILKANIIGTYNLYEAARLAGVKRILFASSNHVCGFYKQSEVIGTDAPARPDGLYGLSNAFGEDVARLYFDRYGMETACVRIGSSFPEPRDRRMLASWMSYDDLERLVMAVLTTPVLGCSVIYGISDNKARWYDNSGAAHIGYRPLDSSEPFRAAVEAKQRKLNLSDPATIYQGGSFMRIGPFTQN